MSRPPTDLNKHIHAQLLDLLAAEPTAHKLNLALRQLAKWRARLIENTHITKQGRTIKHGPFKA